MKPRSSAGGRPEPIGRDTYGDRARSFAALFGLVLAAIAIIAFYRAPTGGLPSALVEPHPTRSHSPNEDPNIVTPWTPLSTPDPYRQPDPTFAPDPSETTAPPAWAEGSVDDIVAGFERSFLSTDRGELGTVSIVFTKTYPIDHPEMLSYNAMKVEDIPEGETRPFTLMIVDGGHYTRSGMGVESSVRVVEHLWVIFHQRYGGVMFGQCDALDACIGQFP